MIKGALVENGVIVNIAKFENSDDIFDGWVSVEDSSAIGDIDNGDDTFSKPEPTEEELKRIAMSEAISTRDSALRNMVHDFGDGRVIQVRPPQFGPDESNMRNAIERMERLSIDTQTWYMADNVPHQVRVADLQEALQYGQDQAAVIWDEFFNAIG